MPTAAKTIREYVEEVCDRAGTDRKVAEHLGYGDGSRVGIWRRGFGRPDELACMKLALWTGDDLRHILRLAGYDEMAAILEGNVAPTAPTEFAAMKPLLQSLQQIVQATLSMPDSHPRTSGSKRSKKR